MTAYQVQNPFFNLTNALGSPVTGGRVFIGVAGQDPEVYPQTVYWDAAQTMAATQPLQLKGGYLVNGSAPAQPYTAPTYSIRAYDQLGNVIFYQATVTSPLGMFSVSTGAAQIGTTSGNNLQTILNRTVWADDFGAKGDGVTNDTAAIQAAITSLVSLGGIVRLTAGKTYLYTALTISGNQITLQGQGAYGNCALRCTATTGNTITVTGQYSGIENLYLQGSQPFGGSAPTAGFAVKFSGCYKGFLRNVRIDYHYSGIQVSNSTETRISGVEMRQLFGLYGVQLYTATGSGASYGCTIIDLLCNNPYPNAYGTAKAWAATTAYSLNDIVYVNSGVYQCVVAGTSGASGGPNTPTSFTTQIADGTAKWQFVCANLTWIEQNSNSYSLRVNGGYVINGRVAYAMRDADNTGSSYPMFGFVWDMEADHNHYAGISLGAGQGANINGAWISSQIAGPAAGGNGNGIELVSNWLGECSVEQTRIFGTAGHGWLNGAGIENSLTNCNIADCGQATTNTYNGVNVAANVVRFKILGNTIGKLVSGTGSQYGGIIVNTGTSDYYVIANNDLSGNVTATLVDGGTGTNKSITNNIGVNSAQAWTNVLVSPGRLLNTVYTNSETSSIMVTVSFSVSGGNYAISYIVGGLTIATNETSSANNAAFSFLVPAGATYEVTCSGGSISSWMELR